MSTTILSNYEFADRGRSAKVHADRRAEASLIDKDQDGILQDPEIVDYLKATEAWHEGGDEQQVLTEFKYHLKKEPNPEARAYHSFDQMAAELDQLEHTYPNIAERVSLGKTHEGRDIWALKISKGAHGGADTSTKTGIVLTGCHHAREWMSVEAPLRIAHELCEGYATDPEMKRRVDQGEIWVVPCVNPDGFEYSRNEDNWWRKNRRPVGADPCGNPTDAIGTDLNRNYLSAVPADAHMYRPEGDTPCSTWDDFTATSDDPDSDTFRGPSGSSEPEVQAMQALERRANIQGVIDHHSYSQLILFPWGHNYEPTNQDARYKEVGNRMNDALASVGAGRYTVEQSAELYPCSGASDSALYSEGVFNYTIEIGRSFQPPASQIETQTAQCVKANMVFIDEILANGAETGKSAG